jgi:hypothetical protein
MNTRRCIDELVMRGADDWVCTGDFVDVAAHIARAETPDEVERVAIELMREVVRQDLMRVGDLPEKDTGERPRPLDEWSGGAEDWLGTISLEWPKRRGSAEYDVYCWFQNTERGEARARQVLADRER